MELFEAVSDSNQIVSNEEGIFIGRTFVSWEALYPSIMKKYNLNPIQTKIEPKSSPKSSITSNLKPVIHNIDVYTDGSHQRAKNYLGFGIYCKYNDVEYSLSQQCDKILLKTYDITEESCSNPTAEYASFAEALKIFAKVKFHKDSTLTFYADYIGVKNWTQGIWKAKKSYIIKVRDVCLQLIKDIGCNIKIVHIPGHSGNYGNDKADKLAGNVTNFSNFDDLIKLLNQ